MSDEKRLVIDMSNLSDDEPFVKKVLSQKFKELEESLTPKTEE